MALGDVLANPSTGFTRFDERDANVSLIANGSQSTNSSYHGGTYTTMPVGSEMKFNFTGSSIKLIGGLVPSAFTFDVYLDSETNPKSYSCPATVNPKVIVFELDDLGNKEHFIVFKNFSSSYRVDAIDILTGQSLKPYKILTSNKFLISSEDKYFTVAQYSESDDIIPALTGNVTAIGNVIRSDENASYPAWQAFDKKAITSDHQFAWISATMMSGWIGFDFSIPIIIDRYSITGRADSAYTMSPKDWTFEGSNDGVNWTVLDTRRNVVDWNTAQSKSFRIANKMSFKMYRINAVSSNSSNGVLIKEIKMGCSNQGIYLKNVKLNNAETAYLSQGMSKSESIGLDISFSTKIFVNPTSTTLGLGKVFKQKIDTTKIKIKKASIT